MTEDTCDVCGRAVDRISAGWAHAFSSADEFVMADHSAYDHEIVVGGER